MELTWDAIENLKHIKNMATIYLISVSYVRRAQPINCQKPWSPCNLGQKISTIH